jgi:hypothetical protein
MRIGLPGNFSHKARVEKKCAGRMWSILQCLAITDCKNVYTVVIDQFNPLYMESGAGCGR